MVGMHELAVTQGVLDLVLDAADREGGGQVTRIDLVVGELASIVDDSVQFYWDIIAEGTAAAGAVLHFRRVPIQFECRDCRALFEPADEDFLCTSCGSGSVRVAAGDELRVESFDLEPAAAGPAATADQPTKEP
ncbi:hydrogenase maturation nickel metallochaperone HypA [bacterium]|nr:hydrogenase maturation nickel metallochaperone HypA [bacterium]